MEVIKAIILGIVQGLTEFLPVSSSGHLVIGAQLLDFKQQSVAFDVCLHLGTLLAVVVVFRQDLLKMVRAPFEFAAGKRDSLIKEALWMDAYVILATLPAVVVGLLFKDQLEAIFSSSLAAYFMLVVTGILMIGSRFLPLRDLPMTWWRSLLIGCAQACAILPGLSRSGSTIFCGMALGIDRSKIARFSFIMSIPAILGAAVLHFGDLLESQLAEGVVVEILLGTISAAIAGYFAIILLLGIIRRNRLEWFGYYCLVVAGLGLSHALFIVG